MSLNTHGEIMTEVLIRGNITTTDAFISDATLQGWLKDAAIYCASYKKWPFTEGRVSTTYVSNEEWNLEGYKADSFRMLLVGGKRLTKLNFQDYLIFREESPQGNDRVFSDFGRVIFINPNMGISGTLVAYGQYMPVVDPTDMAAVTVFSNWDDEGNEAIVQKMLSFLKDRLHITAEAQFFASKADETLEKVYKRVLDEQYAYQTHPDSQGMFKYFNMIPGRSGNNNFNNNPNQF